MAFVNPNIAMSYRGVELPQQNALADYAAVQQIQSGQRQAEVAQMQLEQMRRDQAALAKMQAAITAKGGPSDLNVAAEEMINSGIPEYFKQGLVIKQTLDKQSRFARLLGPTGGAAPAAAPASEAYPGYNEAIGMRAPINALAPASEAYPGYNESIGMTNALAPAPAAPVNPMADLRRKINEAYMIGTPEALAFAKAGEDQLKPTTDVSSMQALGFPSTPAGFAQFKGAQFAPPAPTDIAKLIKERDALPKNDPNRALYDRQIKDLGATAENARQRLAFDQAKFNWEKANPGFEIREADDGSVVGVNKRTLQAFPVTVGGGPAPAAAPAAGGTGMPSARVPATQAPVAGATPTAGKPLMGKGQAMNEVQSNAATFGGAMMQAQSTIDQLEKTGTVKNAVVPGLLTGLAKLVPLGVGENLGNVIQSTFNADPTGLIGPNADQQRLAQAQLAFSIAYLRKTSGAAFGATEVSNTIQEYFPVIGDSKEVIAQKAAARKRAIDGMRISTNAEGKKYIDSFSGGGGEWKVVK